MYKIMCLKVYGGSTSQSAHHSTCYAGPLVQVCATPLKIFQMCRTQPRNISDVQHTTSIYFRRAAHHLDIFQMYNTPPRYISDVQHITSKHFKCAAHTWEYFERAAHHLEKFQVRSTLPGNSSIVPHATSKYYAIR